MMVRSQLRSVVVVAALALSAACAAASDWPQFQKDAQNSGITNDAIPAANLTAKWTTDISGYDANLQLGFRYNTGAVLSNGTLYAYALGAAVPVGDDGYSVACPARLVALNSTNGSVKWVSAALQDEGGYMSHNSPSVDPATGDIYVASWQSLYRVSAADGSLVWKHTLPGVGPSGAVVNGPATIAYGQAYWNGSSGAGRLVGVGVNAGVGGAEVPLTTDLGFDSTVAPTASGAPVAFSMNGQNYIATSYARGYIGWTLAPAGGGIVVLAATNGQVAWQKTQATELPAGATDNEKMAWSFPGSMTFANGVLYARSYDDQLMHTYNGTLYAMKADTGEVLWKTVDRDANPADTVFDNAITGHGAPVVADGKVFIAGGNSYGVGFKVQAYDAATGAWLWDYADIGTWSGQIAFANGRLYVGNDSMTKLSVLDESGNLVSEYIGAGGSPILADGMIYLTDSQGRMVALESVPEPATLSLLGMGLALLLRRRS